MHDPVLLYDRPVGRGKSNVRRDDDERLDCADYNVCVSGRSSDAGNCEGGEGWNGSTRGVGSASLDGAALVMGSAIASIHILGVRRWDLSGVGLDHGWHHVRLGGRDGGGAVHFPGAPVCPAACRITRKIGDRLWALLGIPGSRPPWSNRPAPSSEPRHNPLFTTTLSRRAGHRLPDRPRRCLEHVGHGPSRAGRRGSRRLPGPTASD